MNTYSSEKQSTETVKGYLKRQQDAGALIRHASAICDSPFDAAVALALALVFIGSHYVSDDALHSLLQDAIEDLKSRSPTH